MRQTFLHQFWLPQLWIQISAPVTNGQEKQQKHPTHQRVGLARQFVWRISTLHKMSRLKWGVSICTAWSRYGSTVTTFCDNSGTWRLVNIYPITRRDTTDRGSLAEIERILPKKPPLNNSAPAWRGLLISHHRPRFCDSQVCWMPSIPITMQGEWKVDILVEFLDAALSIYLCAA